MFLGQGRNLESTQVHTFASPLEYHVALRICKALLRWSVKVAKHGTAKEQSMEHQRGKTWSIEVVAKHGTSKS